MLKGIATSWLGAVLTIALTYFLTPYILHQMGQQRYGAWLLISSFTGYLGLLTLGTPMSSVRHLAAASQSKDPEEFNAGVSLLLGVNGLLATAELLIGCLLFPFFRQAYDLGPALSAEALPAFFLLVLQVGFSFVTIVPSAVLQAEGRFVEAHSITTFVLICRGVVTVASLYWTQSLLAMAVTQWACTLCEGTLGWAMVRKLTPAVRFRLRRLRLADVKPLASFSVYVLLLSLGVQLSFQTDALIVGSVLGVETVPYYGVPNSLMLAVMGLIISIAAVVMPTATRLQKQGAMDELRAVFLRWTKIAFTLICTVSMGLVMMGPAFLGVWMGRSYAERSGIVLQILAVASLVFLPVRGVALPLLMGLGQPRQVTVVFLVCAVANIILSMTLIHPLGLAGEALGTAVPNIVFAVVALVLACRAVELSSLQLLLYVVPGPLLGSLPALAFLAWFKHSYPLESYRALFMAGTGMCLIQGIAMALIFRRDAHVKIPRWSV